MTALRGISTLDADVTETPPEGAHAPASYEFTPGTPVSTILAQMTARQDDIIATAWARHGIEPSSDATSCSRSPLCHACRVDGVFVHHDKFAERSTSCLECCKSPSHKNRRLHERTAGVAYQDYATVPEQRVYDLNSSADARFLIPTLWRPTGKP